MNNTEEIIRRLGEIEEAIEKITALTAARIALDMGAPLGIGDIASILGKSPRTIRNLIREMEIGHIGENGTHGGKTQKFYDLQDIIDAKRSRIGTNVVLGRMGGGEHYGKGNAGT